MLAVDRLVLRQVRERDAKAHVQLQLGQPRFLAGEHRARLGAGDNAVGCARCVAKHVAAIAFGDGDVMVEAWSA